MKQSILIILAMALLFLVTGCSSPESRLVGKWVGTTGTIEFFKDKTGIMNPPKERGDMPTNVSLRWDMPDKESVRLVVAIKGGMTSIARLEGKDVLILEGDRFVKQK